MFRYPGVYIKEIPLKPRPIEAIATSITAFLGHVKRGARVTNTDGKPVFIRSVSQYAQQFGPPDANHGGITNEGTEADSFGHAINAFFANGGAKAYVVPVANTPGKPSTCRVVIREVIKNKDDLGHTLIFSATSPGKWADKLLVHLQQDATGTFTLTIGTQDAASQAETASTRKRHDTVLETFAGLGMAAGSAASIADKVNRQSTLVRVKIDATTTAVAGALTEAQAEMAGAVDTRPPVTTDYAQALERLKDYRDIATIVLPGKDWTNDKTVYESAITHAELMKNRMVIIDPQDPRTSATQLATRRDVTNAGFPTSPYSVLYYPYLNVSNPYYDAQSAPNLPKAFAIGPAATAAGVWARIDSERGVWKAPAGRTATVRGTLGPTVLISNTIQRNLNPSGINCLRPIRGPTVVWGARTLASNTHPEYKYVSVRRTQNMIGESLYQHLQTVVFEPNNQSLWSSLHASITDFMQSLFRAGALQGTKDSDAYFVQCGLGSTMTQADINAGIVRAVVGFAPLKPAEFVILKLQESVGQTRRP